MGSSYYYEEPKPSKALRVFSIALGVFIAALLLFFLVRIALSSEGDESKVLLLSPEARAAQGSPIGLRVYGVSTREEMSPDGQYLLSRQFYILPSGDFQVTVRHRKANYDKYAEQAGGSDPFLYTFDADDGTAYEPSARYVVEKSGYVYEVVLFSGVKLDDSYDRRRETARAQALIDGHTAEEAAEIAAATEANGIISAALIIKAAAAAESADPLAKLVVISPSTQYRAAKSSEYKMIDVG